MTPKADHTFGLRLENDAIIIGNLPVTFDGDDIFDDGQRYKGTTAYGSPWSRNVPILDRTT